MPMKRLAAAAVLVMSVLAASGCSGMPASPAATGSVSCAGGSMQTSASPAITVAARPTTLSMTGPSADVACDDATGSGVTGARIESLSVEFDALSCAGSTEMGHGEAVIRWSDGTTSDAAVVVVLDTALTGHFAVFLIGGRFFGLNASVDFIASPSAGDCASGITAETITIAPFALRPTG